MSADPAWNSMLYEELRRLADVLMSRERRDHTLEPTALAHEAWLRLLKSQNAASLERGAFLGLAAQAMRHILTEHARQRLTEKRGGGLRRTTLAGKCIASEPSEFAIQMDEAMTALEAFDSKLARVIELRFYADCKLEEVAETLDISLRTAKRRYRFARAWLQQRMQRDFS